MCHMRPPRVTCALHVSQVAPDFFEYFETMAPLLYRDPTLLTISAFNDNGQARRPEYTVLARNN